jgi:hypothetical protein
MTPDSKAKRGGPRPGAGRPKSPVKYAPLATKCVATKVLAQSDEETLWEQLLHAKDLRIRLEAIKYLTDRRDGKPKQAIEASGPDGGPLRASVEVTFIDGGQS